MVSKFTWMANYSRKVSYFKMGEASPSSNDTNTAHMCRRNFILLGDFGVADMAAVVLRNIMKMRLKMRQIIVVFVLKISRRWGL